MEQIEQYVKIVIAIVGAFVSQALGGWDSAVKVLVVFVAMDYFTGVLAAWYQQKLSSRIGLFGIARKVFVFIMVALAHGVDIVLGDGHVIRDATIFFYLANELLSIIENAVRMNLPVPPVLKKAVEVLQDKGDG